MWKAKRMQMPINRLVCSYCSREIASTQMRRHKQACPQRIHKAPLSELTYGEAKKSGRYAEWINQDEEVSHND